MVHKIFKLKSLSIIICETLDILVEEKTDSNNDILLDTDYSNLSLSNEKIALSEMKWLRDNIFQYACRYLCNTRLKGQTKLSRYEFGYPRKETISEIAKKNKSPRNYLLH